jgi:hypothetical protein
MGVPTGESIMTPKADSFLIERKIFCKLENGRGKAAKDTGTELPCDPTRVDPESQATLSPSPGKLFVIVHNLMAKGPVSAYSLRCKKEGKWPLSVLISEGKRGEFALKLRSRSYFGRILDFLRQLSE